MTIVQQMSKVLPEGYTAEPRVHLGAYFEIDECAYEGESSRQTARASREGSAGAATMTRAPLVPTLTVDADLADQYEYAVHVYDHARGRKLVAAVKIVSPGNEDRAESRRAFVAKCAALLQQNVCVSIVDVITTRNCNLYVDLLALIGRADPAFSSQPPIYAVTCRGRKVGDKPRLETWAYTLTLGKRLPDLPIWLTEELAIELDLETPYEETCRALRIA